MRRQWLSDLDVYRRRRGEIGAGALRLPRQQDAHRQHGAEHQGAPQRFGRSDLSEFAPLVPWLTLRHELGACQREVVKIRHRRERLRRLAAAVNAGHRRWPVVTEPEAADEIAGQSDEQRVLVARRRSGFSIDQGMDGVGRARRSAFHRPAQILEHRRGGARRHHPRRLLRRRHGEHVALGADDGDEKTDLRQQAVVLQGGIGSRQFHRRGVDAADWHERRRAGRSDVEPLDDIVEPLAEAHGNLGPGAVARLRQSEIERDRPPAQAAAIEL